MTARFSRHDNVLTITLRDRRSRLPHRAVLPDEEFALGRAPLNPATHPCTVTNEGVEAERVPHYNPGQNPFIDELTEL
jgi:hypothetical protein